MSYLIVSKLSKYFGAELIFSNVTFQISAQQRMALVGANGTGKTTLLKVLMGELRGDEGSVTFAKKANVGYVTQDTEMSNDKTPWEAMLACREDILRMRRHVQHLESKMAQLSSEEESKAIEDLMSKYSHWQSKYELSGGYDIETTAKMILTGLGLSTTEWHNPLGKLSGGEKMRLALAQALMQEPDLLILDEPTNHLDVQASEWLENYLLRFPGAILLVSHDRYFLDKVATDILELSHGKLTPYKGNYSQYVAQKEHNHQYALKEYQKNKRKADQLQGLIQKFKAQANKASQAKSWEKRLNRLELDEPKMRKEQVRLTFANNISGGREVLTAKDLGHGYDDKILFSDFSCQVRRGEKIAILGPNGCGKSTLLKILLQQLEPWSGDVSWARDITSGYFDQSLAKINEELSVLEQVQQWSNMTTSEARNFLAKYLFKGDDVFKEVGVLSGGERNRLVMSRLFLTEADVLILDEPTNHLDLPAREALEAALQQYEGTVILVTHDRYFLKQIANRFWVFDDEGIVDYQGAYNEIKEFMKERAIA